MKNLYIVTGAAGHLGSTIIRTLSKEDCIIRGLIMPSEQKLFPDRVDYYTGDVTEPSSLEEIFSGTEADNVYVIHTAGLISINDNDYSNLYSVNVQGTKNVIEKCIKYKVKRLLYVSSVHAIPETPGLVVSEPGNRGIFYRPANKFRKSGKTLCAFYFKNNTLGFMIIFGKDERSKLEEIRNELSSDVLETYDNAQTYHDGKWVMFDITDNSILEDLKKLLLIKRKPNRK